MLGVGCEETHKHGVATTLQLLDEALCEIAQWAQGREIQSVLYKERNTLSAGQRQAILAEIDRMRVVLQELQETLGLEPAVQDAKSAIRGKCSVLWEHVVELKAKHLRRYGEVPSELADLLDPKADMLIQGLTDILDTVNRKRGKTSHTDADST